MNIKYRVKDFLGISEISGEVEPGGVHRITGSNASGKSSTLTGIGICLAQKPNPYKLNQSQMGQYAHNGSQIASSELQIGGDFHIKYSVKGNIDAVAKKSFGPAEAIGVCAGLTDPLEWRQKEWGALFRTIMIDFPTFANALLRDWDVNELTGDEDIDAENSEARVARKIYEQVDRDGMPAVLESYQVKLRNSKRDWENAASGDWGGNSYGSNKAATWRPPGWHESWGELSGEEVAAGVTEAEENLKLIESRLVIDDTIRGQHERTAAMLAGYEEEYAEVRQEQQDDDVIKTLTKWFADENNDAMGFGEMIRNTENRIQSLEAKQLLVNVLKCPHCAGTVVQIDGKLLVHDEKAMEKIQAEIKEEEKTLAHHKKEQEKGTEERVNNRHLLDKQISIYSKQLNEIQSEIIQCKLSKEWLEKIRSSRMQFGADEVARAQTALAEAKERAHLVAVVRKARGAASACYQYQRIIKSLDTGSVSEAFEEAGLGGIRKRLRKLGEMLDFSIELDGGVLTYGGRVVSFCSESERWITRFAVQIALAAHFKYPLILVDRFDVLDEYNAKKYLGFFESRNKKKGKPGSVSMIVAGTNRAEQSNGDCHIAKGKRADDNKPKSDKES